MLQVNSTVVAEDDPAAPNSPPEAGDTTAMADIPTGADSGASLTLTLFCISCMQVVALDNGPCFHAKEAPCM